MKGADGRRRVVIMGAAGRDFHVFNTVFRADPGHQVVAFTAAQIPGIADRRYPAELAGPHYPDGIPIEAEADLERVVADLGVDEVVFAYSDLSYAEVMHRSARVLATGADFRFVGPDASMLRSSRPVVAVCAVRTGAGKSQTSRVVARLLRDAGLSVALVRHPMPYGDLVRMRVQRFATLADIDAADPTVEEREEYERPVAEGITTWAGVDYAAILAAVEREADVIVWDGGNNDFSFFRPDVLITVADARRPGHEVGYHPGEVNLRMADVVVVNMVSPATEQAAADIEATVRALRGEVPVVRAASEVTLDDGPPVAGRRVLVVEDGPSLTHGGLATGAGTLAAGEAGAGEVVDPRPFAVGSIADTFATYGHLGPVLPAMGYSHAQVAELAATIDAVDCDVVVAGTPIDLARIVSVRHPIRQARYELRELGSPTLAELLAPHIERWQRDRRR
jgi:predicted GTPase